ncbi:MAG: carboxy terminal-processing peptidase, partial [Ktedonobacteraceae bacterium]
VLDTATDSVPIWLGPLGILVNRSSASAAEIFTEAMKTYNRAMIFGSRTWGKGTIQTLIPLHRYLPRLKAGEMKLTVAEYFDINGAGIQLHGIQPDINIPTHTDLKNSGEEALANALPWRNVATIKYKPINENFDAARLQLKKYFRKKIEKERDFQLFEHDQTLRRTLSDRTSVSLNINQRRTEINQQDTPNRDSNDMALKASIELLGEYVSFSPSIALEFENKFQSPDVAPGNHPCWWSSALVNTLPFPCTHHAIQTIRPPPDSSANGGLKGPGLQR